jgi:hypothetical protein
LQSRFGKCNFFCSHILLQRNLHAPRK